MRFRQQLALVVLAVAATSLIGAVSAIAAESSVPMLLPEFYSGANKNYGKGPWHSHDSCVPEHGDPLLTRLGAR